MTNITFFRMVYQFSMRTITKIVIITKQTAEERNVLPLFALFCANQFAAEQKLHAFARIILVIAVPKWYTSGNIFLRRVPMAVRYNKLWKLLVDRKMSKADLRRAADISSNTLTKLSKDECVALPILDRICSTLKVDYGDIIEHVDDPEPEKQIERTVGK